jgi:tRNA A-37 threonylcarbamoyl transferase component Bud32
MLLLLLSPNATTQASLALTAVFVFVALFHLHLAWRARPLRDPLWFGLVALAMALREWPETGTMPEGPASWMLAMRASWFGLFGGSAAFILFLWPFLGRPIGRKLRAYLWAHAVACLGVLALPSHGLSRILMHGGFLLEVPLLFLFPTLILRESRRGHPEARTIALGAMILFLGAAYEVGYWLGLWPYAPVLTLGFGLFIVSMGISLSNRFTRIHAEAEVLNQELERRVNDRTRALEEAQGRLYRLSEQAAGALSDPKAWSRALEEELRPALGGARLGLWRWEAGRFEALGSAGAGAPDQSLLAALERGPLETDSQSLVPVRGPRGALEAVLVVEAKPGAWTDSERNLLAAFAQQLSGVLELESLRKALHRSQTRRDLERQSLIDHGAGLLQVCPRCGRCYDQSSTHCTVDHVALESPRVFPFRVGERYRLVRRLGEGAAAEVFEAMDERLGRSVALKVIKPEQFQSEAMRQRFNQEARLLAQIHHSGVVAVHDGGDLEDGTLYLVMELLPGASLDRVLAAFGPGKPAQVARLLRDAAAALDAAHDAGVLHRDLKPANIFVLPSPLRFKLLDFGLAKEARPDLALTQSGIIMGTPMYMSPEQIQGKAMDGRSDLFALATVAFEALTGRRTLSGEALMELYEGLVKGSAPRLGEILPSTPWAVERAFLQALARDPAQRPPRAGLWAQRLAEGLERWHLARPGWPEDLQGLPEHAGQSFVSGNEATNLLPSS